MLTNTWTPLFSDIQKILENPKEILRNSSWFEHQKDLIVEICSDSWSSHKSSIFNIYIIGRSGWKALSYNWLFPLQEYKYHHQIFKFSLVNFVILIFYYLRIFYFFNVRIWPFDCLNEVKVNDGVCPCMLMQEMKRQCDEKRFRILKKIQHTHTESYLLRYISTHFGILSTETYTSIW